MRRRVPHADKAADIVSLLQIIVRNSGVERQVAVRPVPVGKRPAVHGYVPYLVLPGHTDIGVPLVPHHARPVSVHASFDKGAYREVTAAIDNALDAQRAEGGGTVAKR